VFNPTPIINLPFPRKTYTDDVQSFSSDQGKFSYYVEAVEGSGNIYGFVDIANSNIADAYVESEIFVPNAFAPRGKNYLWLPAAQFVEKTDYKVTVFDRWGTKVFETTSDTQAWDGKGTTDDMFIYFIEYKNARGEFKQLKGHLFLIR
jgi:gliding motility-associated-like protein